MGCFSWFKQYTDLVFVTIMDSTHHHQPSSSATQTSRAWRTSSRVQFHQGLHQMLAMGFMTNLWVLGTSSMFHKLLHHTEGMYMAPPKASRSSSSYKSSMTPTKVARSSNHQLWVQGHPVGPLQVQFGINDNFINSNQFSLTWWLFNN